MATLTDQLLETRIRLGEAESCSKQLSEQLQRVVEARKEAESNITLQKEHYAELKQAHSDKITEMDQLIAACSEERDQLKGEVAKLTLELAKMKTANDHEVSNLQSQLVAQREMVVKVEEEKKLAKEELASMHGLVAQETESLRFQLSTTSMQLEKTTKVNTDRQTDMYMNKM